MEANWYHRSTSSKLVSASFKSFTFGAECISMWPLCSYRINLKISCWLIKKLSSKYNTSINLITYFSSRTTGYKFEFLPAESCACLIRRRIRIFVFARTKREKPGPKSGTKTLKIQKKLESLNSDFSQRVLTSVAVCTNGDQWPLTCWSIWYRSVPMATRRPRSAS